MQFHHHKCTHSNADVRPRRDDLVNPYWIEDKRLKHGEVEPLTPHENKFWEDMISKYLYPIDENKEQQVGG